MISVTGRVQSAEEHEFNRDIYPVLEKYCLGCHTSDDAEGGFAVDDFSLMLKGGESGPAITPGVPASSRMLAMIRGQLEPKMPPEDEPQPSEQEIALLSDWIDQGAKGPISKMPIKRTLRTPTIKPAANVPSPITAIAFSSSGVTARAMFGTIVISAPDDSEIQIDDKDLGKVNELVFSPDERRLVAASGLTGAYGRAAIYDTQTGELIQEFLGHRDTLYSAVLSPDEQILATAGYDRTIVLWDVETGEQIRELSGHNGAIYDLAFSPDGKVLVSACADETVKVWNVQSGDRLDTLGQSEDEVSCVGFSKDGRFIIAGSADNRLRVWRLRSIEKPAINPLIATRFIDETPILNFSLSPDDSMLVALSEAGNIKVVRTSDWQPVASLKSLQDFGTDLAISPDGKSVTISQMNGELVSRQLPRLPAADLDNVTQGEVAPLYMDLGQPQELKEQELLADAKSMEPAANHQTGQRPIDVARNVSIEGNLSEPGQQDLYRWQAGQGEMWAIDADALMKSRLDPIITILDAEDRPVIRVSLQAVRDSYFTFRGKNSDQINDFRIFNWQEMRLGEYLFAAGEVSRLQMHPRGPDSGFNVYPGDGKRWTYFGTSGTTHALGEPAYIVEPLHRGEAPRSNGLPVFDIPYENDDDPQRLSGKNSRLLFKAPHDGLYTVRISDTRGEGGSNYQYRLNIRAASPGFVPHVAKVSKPLHAGTGREFRVHVDRIDGYEGPVHVEIQGLPERLASNFPLEIEEGQRFATGMVWAGPNEKGWDGEIEPTLVAWAMINGKRVERPLGSIGKLKFDSGEPQVIPVIKPSGTDVGDHERWTLQVRRGETVTARVLVKRKEGFSKEVSFGKETAGRNASQGVYVDNIGLNGLLIVAGADEREFFITADPTATPGKRSFFLTAGIDGGLTSHPIDVEVLP